MVGLVAEKIEGTVKFAIATGGIVSKLPFTRRELTMRSGGECEDGSGRILAPAITP